MAHEQPLGATPRPDGTHFRVWAPEHHSVEVVIWPHGPSHPLRKGPDGHFTGVLSVGAGTRYKFRMGGPAFPDPASRHQPEGVHGPSQVVDLSGFAWSDDGFSGHSRDELVIYELHVGTFSPEGTFDGVTRRLEWLRDLGVTAIELLPVADFPGRHNWGYDGVSPFAPARCYGPPESLQRLVDTAHSLGLSVILDVVYNHLGPDGNYTGVYSPHYLSKSHKNPWGDCLNYDGPHSQHVREFFLQNALYWLREFHFDGLRLDATQAIIDNGPVHFLAELARRVQALPGRRRFLIAEDPRNLASMYRRHSEGGLGLDGVWADDFHHEMRRLLAGDDEGYYRDFRGTAHGLAASLSRGWLFCGEFSTHWGRERGSDPTGLGASQFVICIQNHDQVGNRALGERLNHQISPPGYRAASALLLTAPQCPMLWMGQEWAASSPFCFFTDHKPELGAAITVGRRNEFRHFKAFRVPEARASIPDPQAETTFLSSRLDWDEITRPAHAGTLELYKELLRLRRARSPLRSHHATAVDDGMLSLRLDTADGPLLVVARLKGAGRFEAEGDWSAIMHTEEERFTVSPVAPRIETAGGRLVIEFPGPATVILRG
jgi:maltooligosyltrehalose trehalohydrolase